MNSNSQGSFIRNNKGSTILIVSLVVGVLVLAIGGYFGYSWYQNKLLQERIAKIEKVEETIDDMLKNGKVFESQFEVSKIPTYRNALDDIDSKRKDLEKMEIDKDLEKSIDKCTQVTILLVENMTKAIDLVEKADKLRIRASNIKTNEEVIQLQNEANQLQSELNSMKTSLSISEFEKSKKACVEAKDDIEDLLKTLKK